MALAPSPTSAGSAHQLASSAAYVVVYDAGFRVLAATEGIAPFLSAWPELRAELERGDGVPASLTAFVEREIERARAGGDHECTVLYLPRLLLHVAMLSGAGAPVYAAVFTAYAVRDPVRSAARRFALTPREAEVLRLLLSGLRAADIAERLALSERTVDDYVKSLRAKTGARTRSGMIATLLGHVSRVAPGDPEHAR